jgi:hypothetical protein
LAGLEGAVSSDVEVKLTSTLRRLNLAGAAELRPTHLTPLQGTPSAPKERRRWRRR